MVNPAPQADFLLTPEISEKDIRYLESSVDFHKSYLENLWRTYSAPYRTVYVLDFQEIYTYIFPDRVEAEESVVTNYILENMRSPFMLLSGTWYELLYKIKKTLRDAGKISYFMATLQDKYRSIEALDELREFLTSDSPAPVSTLSDKMNTDLVTLGAALAATVGEYEKSFSRLASLLNRSNHINPKQLVTGQRNFKYDEDLVTTFRHALDDLRPRGIGHSNYADALNLAEIVAIRRYMNEHRHRLPTSRLARIFLLSHSPTLVNIDAWAKDELGKVGEDLTQSPTSVLYQILIQHESPTRTREEIKKRLSLCNDAAEFIRDAVHSLLIAEERIPGTLRNVIQLFPAQEIEQVSIGFPASSPQIDHFRKYVRDPIIYEATTILERNRLTAINRNYSLGGIESTDTQIPHSAAAVQTGMKILVLWNEIQTRYSGNLEDIGMEVQERTSRHGDRQLAIRTTNQNSSVFFLECYETYYSAFWPTGLEFGEFLTNVHMSINDLEISTRSTSLSRDAVLLYSTDHKMDYKSIRLQDLNQRRLVSILSLEKGENLRLLRIATIWGDFCYEQQSIAAGEPVFAGFISKYNLLDAITAMFFRTTSHVLLIPRLLGYYIKEKLSTYPSYEGR